MRQLRLSSSLLLLLFLNVRCEELTVRQTANGPVEGIALISSLGQRYYSFKGIPFAEPPITGKDPYTGEEVDRRFKAPVPLKRTWNTNMRVHALGDFCVQHIPSQLTNHPHESENCLFLNVYVPADGADRKTVLVFIHGGGYSMGDSSDSIYGPDFLMFEDNIVVTVQYRLGIFGFLNLGFGNYTGNMGLKDQQVAIEWVHVNIENFSGNRDEILLFGQSAGAASVGYHLLNTKSRRYFKRAFMSSSTPLNYYALNETNHLQRMKNCSGINDDVELVEYLKKRDVVDLSNCHPYTIPDGRTLSVPWTPTIETSNALDAFITKHPIDIYNSDEAPAMDVMFSFTSKESISFRPSLIYGSSEPLIKENYIESEVDLPFENFNRNTHPKEFAQSLQKLRDAYYPDTANKSITELRNTDFMSESAFTDSILNATILQANANNKGADANDHKNTFLFRFSIDAGLNLIKLKDRINCDGATHADDLCYIFHCGAFDRNKLYDKHLEEKDNIYDIIMRMVKIITNFARNGNPSIEGDTPFKNCKSANEMFCQEISSSPISSVTNNIKEQLHYDTWRQVEEIYKNVKNLY